MTVRLRVLLLRSKQGSLIPWHDPVIVTTRASLWLLGIRLLVSSGVLVQLTLCVGEVDILGIHTN